MPDNHGRPLLHFTPRSGWMNDPHGLTHHDDRYHLFFQHVPGRTTWGPRQRWGHATSADLLHWTEHDVVLSPGEGDHGVWSGSVVTPDGAPAALFYTSVTGADPHLGRARLARPVDASWAHWRKGPVVTDLPDGVDAFAIRDPFVFHDGESWRMLLGAGLRDGTAVALAWVSDDLESWTYDGELAGRHTTRTDPWTGTMWECPQLSRVADRWVLLVSAWSTAGPDNEAYAIGDLVDGRFVAESWHRLSYGSSSYAGSLFVDADGHPCLIHWMRGVGGVDWVGAHTLPQRLKLENARLRVRPHPAVTSARVGQAVPLSDVGTEVGDPCDVEWTVDGGRAGLTVTTPGSDPIILDAATDRLAIRVGGRSWQMPLGGSADVRVILDGPTLEVFTAAGSFGAPAPGAGRRTLAVTGAATAVAHRLS